MMAPPTGGGQTEEAQLLGGLRLQMFPCEG